MVVDGCGWRVVLQAVAEWGQQSTNFVGRQSQRNRGGEELQV